MITNKFMTLSDEELTRLYNNFQHSSSQVSARLYDKIWFAYYDRFPRKDFNGMSFPVTEESSMVLCIHEGVCPTCGRPAQVTTETALWARIAGREWGCDWDVCNLECSKGHTHTAEPNESATDWVAW